MAPGDSLSPHPLLRPPSGGRFVCELRIQTIFEADTICAEQVCCQVDYIQIALGAARTPGHETGATESVMMYAPTSTRLRSIVLKAVLEQLIALRTPFGLIGTQIIGAVDYR